MRSDERLEYEADVAYEVWRSGGNPDLVDRDRCEDAYYRGVDEWNQAAAELRRQRPEPPEQEDDSA